MRTTPSAWNFFVRLSAPRHTDTSTFVAAELRVYLLAFLVARAIATACTWERLRLSGLADGARASDNFRIVDGTVAPHRPEPARKTPRKGDRSNVLSST
jgi:hypothetical protein